MGELVSEAGSLGAFGQSVNLPGPVLLPVGRRTVLKCEDDQILPFFATQKGYSSTEGWWTLTQPLVTNHPRAASTEGAEVGLSVEQRVK